MVALAQWSLWLPQVSEKRSRSPGESPISRRKDAMARWQRDETLSRPAARAQAVRSSLARISLHWATHSLQMKTPLGPAIRRRTWA